jgi:hypothetical protein
MVGDFIEAYEEVEVKKNVIIKRYELFGHFIIMSGRSIFVKGLFDGMIKQVVSLIALVVANLFLFESCGLAGRVSGQDRGLSSETVIILSYIAVLF